MKIPEDLYVDDSHEHLRTVSLAAPDLWKELQKTPGGTHLEIGCRIGASVIVAAEFAATITCIDPMQTEEGGPGYSFHELGVEALFWANMYKFDIAERVEMVVALSYPFPKELEDRMWDTAFVDGDHSHLGVLRDLKNLRHRIRKWIMIDDSSMVDTAREIFLRRAPEWIEEPCDYEHAVILRRTNAN